MPKTTVVISGLGLTPAEMRAKLEKATNDLKERIEKNFPHVPVLGIAWVATSVLLEIQNESEIPKIETACDCKLRKNERLQVEQ